MKIAAICSTRSGGRVVDFRVVQVEGGSKGHCRLYDLCKGPTYENADSCWWGYKYGNGATFEKAGTSAKTCGECSNFVAEIA